MIQEKEAKMYVNLRSKDI